ncbi:MAG: serine/threonine protein kinase [Myxococcaceae bacterium]|nr:serine/threonine protein kinase [Myxococcaceae bacterium]
MDGAKLEDAPDPLVGRTIGGRYLVAELIGTGGMGTVYRGRHQLVGRDVALKFLSPRYATDPAARERFLREARAANRIDHEHIIDITDFGETNDKLVFLVMEYLEGETLSRVIEKGPLEPKRALTIAWQMATALARAHELDVIHRDIKPDNIFVLQRRGGDFVKLLDFGLARVLGEHRLTATGKVFGTPEYLAPEQARGEVLTGHADQYALGCVMYEMLSGCLPFEGPSPDVVIKHLHATAEPPSVRNPALQMPHELDALVMRMLAKNPRDRFTDAYHLADELRGLLDQIQGGRASKPPRRSGVLSVPAPESQATQPWVDAAEETWAARYELFEGLLARAYPGGEPELLKRSMRELGELVAQARQLRMQLSENLLRAKEHEDNLRAARLRVGHAADELGQDESRVVRRIAEAHAIIENIGESLSELDRPLLEGLRELSILRGARPTVTRDTAELLRALGGYAQIWLETEDQLAAQHARVLAGEREREDLRFQIAQLKGRLGILNAEADDDLNTLREQAEALEASLSRNLEQLTRTAEPINRALSEFPNLREALSDVRAATDRRNAS